MVFDHCAYGTSINVDALSHGAAASAELRPASTTRLTIANRSNVRPLSKRAATRQRPSQITRKTYDKLKCPALCSTRAGGVWIDLSGRPSFFNRTPFGKPSIAPAPAYSSITTGLLL